MADEITYDNIKEYVLEELKSTLSAVDIGNVERLKLEILKADKIFVVGVGRTLLALQAFAKRLNHLGKKTWFVGEINEPAITNRDLLIVGSGSGETLFPLAIAKKAKQFGVTVVHIGSNGNSSMSGYSDLFVRIPAATKLYLDGEIPSRQIMTSLFEQSLLLFGDILAKMIVEDEQLDLKSLWRMHANLE
ncbi:MAG: 6-phospho-3-hexuloisomerase [Planctomycetia bacterium]|nr:6-phospho-3-hexuloisomerase [Planctomycetia bacterium]